MLIGGTLCLSGIVDAKPWWMRGAEANQADFLPPDEAFKVSARIDAGSIRIRWVIADGYYLYRERMEVKAESPDLLVSDPIFPHGTTKTDPYLGTQEIFTQQVEGSAAFTRADADAHPVEIKVTYQGCAEAGLCYPPITQVIFPGVGAPAVTEAPAVSAAPGIDGHGVKTPPHRWEEYAILGGCLAFFLAGLLLRRGRHLALPS